MKSVLLFTLLLPLSGFSQEAAVEPSLGKPPFILKIGTLNLINNIQQSVDGMIDIPLSPKLGVELGVNYVFDSGTFAQKKGETYKGFKYRTALKYYFDRSEEADYYLALAVKYVDIKNDRYVDIIRQGGQYSQTIMHREYLHTWGVALRIGSQYYLGRKKRFLMEPFFAVGLRQRTVSEDALPPDAELLDNNFERLFGNNRQLGITTTPDMMMGLSLGWKLSAF